MSNLPEPFTYDRANDLRKELDTKIDKKLDAHVFYWIMGVLITVILIVFSSAFYLILRCSENYAQLKEQIIRFESKADMKHR